MAPSITHHLYCWATAVLPMLRTTGAPQHTRRHRLVAWARGLAAVLLLLPGWGAAQTGVWSAVAEMGNMRAEHTATLLPNGKVLVAGGSSVLGLNSPLASAELYDQVGGTWSSAGSMGTARSSHTATLLLSGKVLVTGGVGTTGPGGNILASAELYDPADNSWSSVDSMGSQRHLHTATLLPNGKVLVAGGTQQAGAELFDPADNSWSSVSAMGTPRMQHTATLLPNGKVLVAGSYLQAGAELFDPADNSWSSANSMGTVRVAHSSTLLPSGKVLVVGGYSSGHAHASAELYDPVTGIWTPTAGSMGTARDGHTATLLPSGKVLVAGGGDPAIGSNFDSAELYDPATNSWSNTGSMGNARGGHTATLLPSGKVLAAGGSDLTGYFASAELYDTGYPTVTAVTPATGPTLGGTAVTVTGTNFTGATSATVCGAALASLVVVNDTTLTGTTPAHAAAACDVVVTTAIGSGTGAALFSYTTSSQTLTFGAAPALVVGGAAGTLSATSSATAVNGLTTFSSLTPAICTVSGASVTPVAAGTCTVAANNPGNADYTAAPQVTQAITVGTASTPVRSVTGTPPGASPITASFTGGSATCGYASSQFPTAVALGGTLPAGYSFDQGAFGFTTTVCGTGATLTLTLTFDQPLAANAKLFKFNGTTWAEFPATISGTTVTYQVTDGGAGDSNPADGVITDPVAVGVPNVVVPPVVVTPVPTLGQWALVLLSLMAAALGAGTLRRRAVNYS